MKPHIPHPGILLLLVCNLFLLTSCSQDGGYDGSSGETGIGGSMARFAIKDDILYVVDDLTLKLFDVSNSPEPYHLSSRDMTLQQGAETVFIMDTLLFIGSQTGMYIYDITNADFPNLLSMTSHIRSCDPVVAAGNYAYITLNTENTWCGRNNNELQVYDITRPTAPTLQQAVSTSPAHPKGLGIANNKLFVCFNNGLRVYDLTNPALPRWEADLERVPGLTAPLNAYDIIPLDGHLLVTCSDGLFQFKYHAESKQLTLLSKINVLKAE